MCVTVRRLARARSTAAPAPLPPAPLPPAPLPPCPSAPCPLPPVPLPPCPQPPAPCPPAPLPPAPLLSCPPAPLSHSSRPAALQGAVRRLVIQRGSFFNAIASFVGANNFTNESKRFGQRAH
ncbi:vegetative cell wall protein gp1-like [Schistocerca americana]|uniref:vegetative cell wall protein gp1-like n=1 Tax=Schistocerca americana TaxID=7009 RepID=UPI001F4F504E|nr:vegetative cell wall protein gp1-like [Schistocerca americana]